MIRILLLGVLLLLVARAFWWLVSGVIEIAGGLPQPRRGGGGRQAVPVRLVRDPVCGTHVPKGSALSAPAAGGTTYFCSEQCRSEYLNRG